jgi:hypothetical protein
MTDLGCNHRRAWVAAAGLGRTSQAVSVDLPGDSTHRVGGDRLGLRDQLEVTRLGARVALYTPPDSNKQLTVGLGYAQAGGRCSRDGSRHPPLQPSASPQVDVVAVRR